MLNSLRIFLFFMIAVTASWGQGNHPISDGPPTQIVDQLWKLATQGDLLTADGWERSRGVFKNQTPQPVSRSFNVVSNVWGPASQKSSDGTTAEVVMGFDDAGHIDGSLKYTPPKESSAVKVARVYHLVFEPTKFVTYRSDGKNLIVDKTIVGPKAWQIADPPDVPFTTVNTAIRYVLEMRKKSDAPEVQRNADATIERLLSLN